MHTVGIIAEYNPFHRGHQFQYNWIREKLGDRTAIIVALTSNFCQRGNPAIQNISQRSRSAIQAGADLVLLLPQCFSAVDAENYAKAGINLLSSTGVIHSIAASSEIFDKSLLQKAATFISPETEELKLHIKEGISAGLSPHKARQSALEKIGVPNEVTACFNSPNSRLVVEYLASLNRLANKAVKHKPDFFLCPRLKLKETDPEGNHPKCITPKEQMSSSQIRDYLINSSKTTPYSISIGMLEKLHYHIPQETLAILLEDYKKGKLLLNWPETLLARLFLLRETSPDTLSKYRYMGSGLAERLVKQAYSEDIVNGNKTLNYPEGRIRRALLSLYLDIDNSITERIGDSPSFILPLAFNQTGRYLLRKIKANAELPLLGSFSDTSDSTLPEIVAQAIIERRSFALRALLTGNPADSTLILNPPQYLRTKR